MKVSAVHELPMSGMRRQVNRLEKKHCNSRKNSSCTERQVVQCERRSIFEVGVTRGRGKGTREDGGGKREKRKR